MRINGGSRGYSFIVKMYQTLQFLIKLNFNGAKHSLAVQCVYWKLLYYVLTDTYNIYNIRKPKSAKEIFQIVLNIIQIMLTLKKIKNKYISKLNKKSI